jgi:hypothetical protein
MQLEGLAMPVRADSVTNLVSLSRQYPYFGWIISGWIGHYCTAARLKAKFRQLASVFDAFCVMLSRCSASYRRLTKKGMRGEPR